MTLHILQFPAFFFRDSNFSFCLVLEPEDELLVGSAPVSTAPNVTLGALVSLKSLDMSFKDSTSVLFFNAAFALVLMYDIKAIHSLSYPSVS